MSSATEFLQAGQEGFEKKDSSGVEKYITDDFRFVSNVRNIGKQETLDWTSTGEMAIDNLEVIYENDEVAVVHHSANRKDNDGVAMVVYLKRGDKISGCRVIRAAV